VLTNLANTKLQLEDYDGVEQQLRQALGILQRLYAPDHSDIQVVLSSLGRFYYSTGRIRESMSLFEQIIATSRHGGTVRRPLEATAQQLLGELFRDVGDFEAARVHIQAATDIWREFPGESRLRYAISLADQSLLLLDEGNATRATQPLEEAMTIARKLLPQDDNDLASLLVIHGMLLTRTGKSAASEATLREALSIYSQVLPATHREVAAANSALGEALLAQGKLVEAEKLLTASDALLAKQLNAARRRSLQRLIRLYELKHELPKLTHYRQQLAAFELRVRSV
jgi:tetratricopeptide (TPR) repeat protein